MKKSTEPEKTLFTHFPVGGETKAEFSSLWFHYKREADFSQA
jgi:hypothetical protein